MGYPTYDYTFESYQDEALVTARSDDSQERRLSNFSMGLAGESGEVVDAIKKLLYHKTGIFEEQLRDELGDVLWYLAALANEFGFSLEDVAKSNIEKLRARHKGGGFKPHDEQVRETVDADGDPNYPNWEDCPGAQGERLR